MQPKDYFKNKARKLAKQTWAGPGKFGVFIVICIIVIAFFESLGLSNREKNLELRNVQNIVIPMNFNMEKINEGFDQVKPDASSIQGKFKILENNEIEKSNMERENILLFGAMDQYIFEHQQNVEKFEMIESPNERTKYFLSLLLKEKEEILNSQEAADIFLFDI